MRTILSFILVVFFILGCSTSRKNINQNNLTCCPHRQEENDRFGPGIDEEFKKDPHKYLSRIKEFKLEAFKFGYDPEVIKVKKGDVVRLLATSRDINHGIYIKKYGIDVTLKKGKVKKIEFIADKSGTFPVICSIYCGRGHHSMTAKLIATEE